MFWMLICWCDIHLHVLHRNLLGRIPPNQIDIIYSYEPPGHTWNCTSKHEPNNTACSFAATSIGARTKNAAGLTITAVDAIIIIKIPTSVRLVCHWSIIRMPILVLPLPKKIYKLPIYLISWWLHCWCYSAYCWFCISYCWCTCCCCHKIPTCC